MIEKVLQILAEIADIGCFVIVAAEKAVYAIERLKARRVAGKEEEGSEDR